jgi:hypothetical protein
MLRGLRVVFSPNPVGRLVYSHHVPEPGTRGTVTAARVAGGLRTYLDGPGGGLVYVQWDADALVCAVSMRDLTLEPEDGHVVDPCLPSYLRAPRTPSQF